MKVAPPFGGRPHTAAVPSGAAAPAVLAAADALSGRFFVDLPQLLLDLGGQGVEQVLLHDQARPLQLPALAQLHRQAFQAVSSQLQLRQPRQLPKAGRQRLQAIVSQVQSAELLALEQLVWQALNLFVAGKRMESNIKAFILRCLKKQFS